MSAFSFAASCFSRSKSVFIAAEAVVLPPACFCACWSCVRAWDSAAACEGLMNAE
ncbi:MAG: hypothetical protein R3F13_07895 [Prosthecobacter sp.]